MPRRYSNYDNLSRLNLFYSCFFTLYWDRDTNILFACQKAKGEESSQDMGFNPIVQKWWDYMADIMEENPDNSPVTIPLK